MAPRSRHVRSVRRVFHWWASLPRCGSVAGRIDEVLTTAEIIDRTVTEFDRVVAHPGQGSDRGQTADTAPSATAP